MEPERSPITSLHRVAIAIGTLGLVWLVLAGQLVLQLDQERLLGAAELPPAVAAHARFSGSGAAVTPSVSAERAAFSEPSSAEGAPGASESDVRMREGSASDTRTIENVPAGSAEMPDVWSPLPLDEALQRLLPRLQALTLEQTDQAAEDLAGSAAAVAERINAEGRTLLVHFRDPDVEAARRTAVRAHALLVETGLRPWLLATFGGHGEPGVHVSFAE